MPTFHCGIVNLDHCFGHAKTSAHHTDLAETIIKAAFLFNTGKNRRKDTRICSERQGIMKHHPIVFPLIYYRE
jgi:hypothetical protein